MRPRLLHPLSLLTFSAAIFLTGCELLDLRGTGSSGHAQDVVLTLEEHERADLPAFDASLTFDRVVQDSRCPDGAVCVWAGEAEIHVTFRPETASGLKLPLKLAGLMPSEDALTSVDTLGYRFTLVKLEPYPSEADTTATPKTATIRIQRP